MLTPWTVIEAVHAVQRPLLAPEFTSLSIHERQLGQTSARPLIHARCSIDSTDRLDLYRRVARADRRSGVDDSTTGPIDRHDATRRFRSK